MKSSVPLSLSLGTVKSVALGLSVSSFVIPFVLGNSQFVTGLLVNTALFASVALLPKKFFWPIIVLPSLGVLSRGLVFGPLTPFLFYFLPFIWLGNLGLVMVFKKTSSRLGYSLGVLLASLAKFLLLFAFANLMFRFNLVPRLFLTAMGINQLITACLGGFLVLPILQKIAHGRIQS